MKSNNMFKDQVKTISSWFQSWSECEQTVALYSLLKRLSPIQVKFIAQVLEQSASDCSQVQRLEEEANNPDYISQLCSESKETAVKQLLSHLPLLRSGNADAKRAYLQIIPQVLSYSIDNRVHIEESRQLLSFSLIHPAITSDERFQFRDWLSFLEERFAHSISQNRQNFQALPNTYTNRVGAEEILPPPPPPAAVQQHMNIGSTNHLNGWNDKLASEQLTAGLNLESSSSDPHMQMLGNFAKVGATRSNSNIHNDDPRGHLQTVHTNKIPRSHIPLHATSSDPLNIVPSVHGINSHAPLRRTNSVTPPDNISDWLAKCEDLYPRVRPLSSTSDHAPLSPQSSVTSSGSGSDTHQDEGGQPIRNSFTEPGSGMQDVPIWLKSLRLHKYSYLFQLLSYEDMMDLSEQWLEEQNVTKGARHKIVLSIQKLKDRHKLLRTLEQNIISGGSIKTALAELKSILNTPMKANADIASNDKLPIRKPNLSPISEGDASQAGEDLPKQFTRVMGKICTQLLVGNRIDEESRNIYLQLIDKCINHEAFTQKQRKLLTSWKQEIQITSPPKYNIDVKPRKNWGNTFPICANSNMRMSSQRMLRDPQKPTAAGLSQWSFGSKRSSVIGCGHIPISRKNSYSPSVVSNPIEPVKSAVTKTQSAPSQSSQMNFLVSKSVIEIDREINDSLDSLCRSMTEIALGMDSPTTIIYPPERVPSLQNSSQNTHIEN
ncbi:protein Smaug homolog 1-like isoform X2 [Octopus sinensis]|uniref:Protein Smaug homolog 1-like isoform X2 n=1 Tax=Octopus sinensis TaxID=2607531 RepID=A0A7E6FKS0_9MOLL|nr:protein Smaug homolog 1-like isoform X2 [Octopus sinensis]